MQASVIVCTFNRVVLLENTLSSLEKLTVPADWSWELLIVDNNSSDTTEETVKKFASNTKVRIRYIFEKKQGLSNARNRGISEAKGEIIAFADDDMEFDPNWLFHMIMTFKQFDCLCVAGKIIPKWECPKPPWIIEEGPYRTQKFHGSFDLGRQIKETNKSPFGGNMAFRRSVFERYGLFRTDLGRSGANLMSNEETELCQRLFSDGKSVIYNPKAVNYHLINKKQAQKSYYLKRNFCHGKSFARTTFLENNTIYYSGVPRYLFRECVSNIFKWQLTIHPHVRFFYKQKLYHVIGRIVEYYNMSRKKSN